MQRQDNFLQKSYNQSREGVPVSQQEERYRGTPKQYASEGVPVSQQEERYRGTPKQYASEGVPVSQQEERYRGTPKQYASEGVPVSQQEERYRGTPKQYASEGVPVSQQEERYRGTPKQYASEGVPVSQQEERYRGTPKQYASEGVPVSQQEERYRGTPKQYASEGVPVSQQEERYRGTPEQYASEPSSTSTVQPASQSQNQLYTSHQEEIKQEPNIQRTDNLSESIYDQHIKHFSSAVQSYSQRDKIASSQPQPEMYKSHVVQPQQAVISSTQSTTNLFYENAVRKGSELKLSLKERQTLMSDNKHPTDIDISAISSEEVVSTDDGSLGRSGLDLNLDESNSSDLSNRPMSSDKAHVCLTCFKGFKNKPQLTQHELVHNGIRKHTCSYCEKSFKQLCHLNQHIRTHTGERPYKCIIEGCGRSFAQLSNLHHHQKNHEEHVKRDVARQYRCVICDRSYANESSLRTHTLKLHINLNKVDTDSLQNTGATKKRKRKHQGSESSETESAVIELGDDNSPPTQVKTGFNLTSHNQNPSSASSTLPSSSLLNQSALSRVAQIIASSPQDAINRILQKRLLSENQSLEDLILQRSTASQQLQSPSFQISEAQTRQSQNVVSQFSSLPKVSELGRPIPSSLQQAERTAFSQETYNQERLPQSQVHQQKEEKQSTYL